MRPTLNDFTSRVMAVAQWAKSNGFEDVAKWMATQELAMRRTPSNRKRGVKLRTERGDRITLDAERVAELVDPCPTESASYETE